MTDKTWRVPCCALVLRDDGKVLMFRDRLQGQHRPPGRYLGFSDEKAQAGALVAHVRHLMCCMNIELAWAGEQYGVSHQIHNRERWIFHPFFITSDPDEAYINNDGFWEAGHKLPEAHQRALKEFGDKMGVDLVHDWQSYQETDLVTGSGELLPSEPTTDVVQNIIWE